MNFVKHKQPIPQSFKFTNFIQFNNIYIRNTLNKTRVFNIHSYRIKPGYSFISHFWNDIYNFLLRNVALSILIFFFILKIGNLILFIKNLP